jgi:hypothetical protein
LEISGVEEFEDAIGWSGDYCPVAEDSNGSLHEFGMCGDQVDHDGRVVQRRRVDVQRIEPIAPADHLRRAQSDHVQDSHQQVVIQRLVHVLDDVELDAALLENFEGAPGLPSDRVVDE